MNDPGSTIVWFGKHKGKRLSEVPRQYLEWCLKERAGGGELVSDIAAFLMIDVPKKIVGYEKRTMTHEQLEQLQSKPGFHDVKAFVDGVDVMGVCNCHHLFNPDSDWTGRQEWDGRTPPWLDQSCVLDAELKSIIC